MNSQLFFSDYFGVSTAVLEKYGALDICIEADLPLFIDPFLLFASEKKTYQALHDKIVEHLVHLKQHAVANPGEANISLFQFPEIKQNWLGDCKWGNVGRGLGKKFARDVIAAFNGFYSNFGEETLTTSSHIEKLTLVGSGIGRDFISDFTANLMLEYLLEYTQKFAKRHLPAEKRKVFSVRCVFNSKTMVWMPKVFELPYFFKGDRDGDFLILTPLDILSKDDAFICHSDFHDKFRSIASTISNRSLRDAINLFFQKALPKKPKGADVERAINATAQKFPIMLDHYIRNRESNRDEATLASLERVNKLKTELLETMTALFASVSKHSNFYSIAPDSYASSLERVNFLKHVIENNDGYRIFYKKGKAIASEDTIQRIFRLTWFASPMDVNAEVNNGRGPADYKISYGNRDSCIVEFKLGSSKTIRKNLLNQTEIYKKASKSINDIKVILCYTKAEIAKVARILKSIHQEKAENIVVIDATKKISASKQ